MAAVNQAGEGEVCKAFGTPESSFVDEGRERLAHMEGDPRLNGTLLVSSAFDRLWVWMLAWVGVRLGGRVRVLLLLLFVSVYYGLIGPVIIVSACTQAMQDALARLK